MLSRRPGCPFLWPGQASWSCRRVFGCNPLEFLSIFSFDLAHSAGHFWGEDGKSCFIYDVEEVLRLVPGVVAMPNRVHFESERKVVIFGLFSFQLGREAPASSVPYFGMRLVIDRFHKKVITIYPDRW